MNNGVKVKFRIKYLFIRKLWESLRIAETPNTLFNASILAS